MSGPYRDARLAFSLTLVVILTLSAAMPAAAQTGGRQPVDRSVELETAEGREPTAGPQTPPSALYSPLPTPEPAAAGETSGLEPAPVGERPPGLWLGLWTDHTIVGTGELVRVTLVMTNTTRREMAGFQVGVSLPSGLVFQKGEFTWDAEWRLAWTSPQTLRAGERREIPFLALVETGAPPRLVVSAAPASYQLDQGDPAKLVLLVKDAGEGAKGDYQSEFEGGWVPQFSEPVVATFSGAATFDYSIELPPGRNGLQPALSLNYSSRRVDGLINWEGSEWVGLGWNIDAADIVRMNVRYKWSGDPNWITYDDRFQLVLNGTSYHLVPQTAGQKHGRYFADGGPELYIVRINDCTGDGNCYDGDGGSGSNRTSEYWQVKTPDGTVYRLGYHSQSEQVLYQTGNCYPSCSDPYSPYSGPVPKYSAYRWRVDQVTDVWGNTMEYQYLECRSGGGSCLVYTNGPASQREINSYLDKIWYNRQGSSWLTTVEFLGEIKDNSPAWNEPPIFVPRRKLNSVKVWWESALVSEIKLNHDSYYTPSSSNVFLLTGIVPYGLGGIAGGHVLPGPTFGYQDYPNKGFCLVEWEGCDTEWEQETFPYERMAWAENGYGGRFEFDYVNDGRGNWRKGFYNYRVSERRVYDGLGSGWDRLDQYSYGSPCYDQWNSANGTACTWLNNPEGLGPLVGHTWTHVTVSDPGGALQVSKHYYHTDTGSNYLRRGREYQGDTFEANGTILLQRVVNSYGVNDSVCDATGLSGASFVCLKETQTTEYDPGSGSSRSKKVGYAYQRDHQGGAQYGNVTQINEYQGDTPYRITERWYTARNSGGVYLVRPITEGLFAGDGSTLLGSSCNYYDGNPQHYDSLGDHGALTRMQRLQLEGEDASTRTFSTSDVTYSYDAYGNRQTETSYADYGGLVQSTVTWTMTWTLTPTLAHTATTEFDAYHLLPVTRTNPMTQVTVTGYDDDLPWLPASVTDPNGATTTFEYDPFGRLIKIFRPGDDPEGLPSRYMYYSDVWQPQWEPFQVSIWNKADPSETVFWSDGGIWSNTFYDGLGRVVEAKRPAEDWVEEPSESGHDIVQFLEYDAQGLQVAASVPYTVSRYVWTGPTPGPYVEPSSSIPRSQTHYDALGRPVRVTQPDETGADTLHGIGFATAIDANRHARLSFSDELDRLTAVEETLVRWRDDFEDGATTGWTVSQGAGSVSEPGGVLKIIGGGGWDTYAQHLHSSAGETEQGVLFDFKLTGSSLVAFILLDHGTWDQNGYRRWGLYTNGSTLYAERVWYDGARTMVRTALLGLTKGVWYRALLKVDAEDEFITQVWERDDPTVRGELREARPWNDREWRFVAQVQYGTLEMDDYDELTFYTTRYTYDPADNLVAVTDTLGISTSMTYDWFGRKVAMHDPDMGDWSYGCDAAGNLVTQTDALEQSLLFDYDPLNRLLEKSYEGQVLARYYYDEEGYGASVGRRTRMEDLSGSSAWGYDERGRVITATRSITGVGVYTTTYGYDPLGRVVTTTYPSGEVVTATYNPQNLPESLVGDDPYVTSADYDALDQATAVSLGNSLATAFSYDAFNHRLRSIETGSLLSLNYGYDLVGNVTAIDDGTVGETLRFGYDELDRLTTFEMAESTMGSVTIRAKGEYANGWPAIQLRVNGIVVQEWTVSSSSWVSYTAQAALTGQDQVDVAFTNDYYGAGGDRNLFVDRVRANGQTMEAESSAVRYDRGKAEAAFDGLDVIAGQEGMLWAGALRMVAGTADNWAAAEGYSYGPTGNITGRNVVSGTQWITRTYNYSDSAHVHAVTGLSNGWEFGYDLNGNMTGRADSGSYIQAFDVENRLVAVTDTQTLSVTRFVYDGDGNRVLTIYPDGSQTAFVGDHYEVEGNTARSYYFLGSQRVAMRVDDGASEDVYWFHTDRLGSTSLLSTISGTLAAGSETRFRPYGEYRVEPTADLTDHGYTGHKQQDTVGLVYMRARYYVPGVGRFASADSIVPGAGVGEVGAVGTIDHQEGTRLTPLTVSFHEAQLLGRLGEENREMLQFGPAALWDQQTRREHSAPQGPPNPQALNRYTYCLNDPLNYHDPSGHWGITVYRRELLAEDAARLIEFLDTVDSWVHGLAMAGYGLDSASALAGIYTLLSGKEVLGMGGLALLTGVSAETIGAALVMLAPYGVMAGISLETTAHTLDELHDALVKLQADTYGAVVVIEGMPGLMKLTVETEEGAVTFNCWSFVFGNYTPQVFWLWSEVDWHAE